jgi:enoyl-CoA hydratase/carnithine racemase
MAFETIIYQKKERVAYITLNRPNKINAMSATMQRELMEALYDFRDDNDSWVAIISGAGEKGFSSGHDLSEDTQVGFKEEMRASFWRTSEPTLFGTFEIWKPIIAAVHGYCLAGGMELALACDIRVAAENAKFGLSEVLRALLPGGGGIQRLARIVPFGLALELSMTGDMIDAQEAWRIGLANHVVPLDQVMPKAEEIARKLCDNGPLPVRAIKESAYRSLDLPLEHALRINTILSRINRDTEDSMEGPRAFVEKRPPVYKAR